MSGLRYLGLSHSFTHHYVFDAQVLRLDFKDSANDVRLLVARALNHLSRRTAVYLTAGRASNDGNAAFSASAGGAGLSQTGVMAGMRHAF